MVQVGYELIAGSFSAAAVVGTVITYLAVKKIWGDWVVVISLFSSFLSSLSYLRFALATASLKSPVTAKANTMLIPAPMIPTTICAL
jgi:hypothetical protein